MSSTEELRTWLAETIAGYVRCELGDIDPDLPLAEYGLDSVSAMTICADIEDHFGLIVEVTLVWDHPTLGELAGALAAELAASPSEGLVA